MDIRNSSRWVEFNVWEQWLGTLGLTMVAFALRSGLQPVLAPYGVFHFFILAVLIVQHFFGYRMALLSTVLSVFLGEVYFVEPYGEMSHWTDKDLILSLNFVLVVLPAIYLLEKLHRTLYASQLLHKINGSRLRVSLRRENDRMYFSKKMEHSVSFSTALASRFDDLLWIKLNDHAPQRGPAFFRLFPEQVSELDWHRGLSPGDWTELNRSVSGTSIDNEAKPKQLTLQFGAVRHELAIELQILALQDLRIKIWILARQPDERVLRAPTQ